MISKSFWLNITVQLFWILQHPQNDFVDRSMKTALIMQCGSHFTSKTTNLNWDPKLPNYSKVSYNSSSLCSTTVPIILQRWQGYSRTIPQIVPAEPELSRAKCYLPFFSFVCNKLKFRWKKLKLCFFSDFISFSYWKTFGTHYDVTFCSPCNVSSGWGYNRSWLSNWLWLIVHCRVELTAFGHLL